MQVASKIAILGTVPNSRNLAPLDDPEWDIWVCSPGNRGAIKRVTEWFELHGVEDLKGAENAAWNGEYFAWLRAQNFPVWMQEPNDLVPGAKVFPHRKLLDEFGRLGRLAFTSSIAWMVAFAVHRGAKEIGVFGVDMAANEEAYTMQKFGCLLMFHMAAERGISIKVPLESSLDTMPPLYGYDRASRMGRHFAIKIHEAKQALATYDQTIARLTNERAFCAGGLDAFSYIDRTFVDGERDAEIDVTMDEPIVAEAQSSHHHGLRPVVIPDLGKVNPHTVAVDTTDSGLLVPHRLREA